MGIFQFICELESGTKLKLNLFSVPFKGLLVVLLTFVAFCDFSGFITIEAFSVVIICVVISHGCIKYFFPFTGKDFLFGISNAVLSIELALISPRPLRSTAGLLKSATHSGRQKKKSSLRLT